jgi:hypothetical protein
MSPVSGDAPVGSYRSTTMPFGDVMAGSTSRSPLGTLPLSNARLPVPSTRGARRALAGHTNLPRAVSERSSGCRRRRSSRAARGASAARRLEARCRPFWAIPAAGRTPAPYAAAARAMINTVRTQDQQALTRTEGRRPLTPTQYSRAALLRSLRRRLQRTAVS